MPKKRDPLEETLFGRLPLALSLNLRDTNPWWRHEKGVVLPTFKRWIFPRLLKSLKKGMTPATVLRGPRRVGKTVLLRQIIETLLAEGVPGANILYVAFDELPTIRGLKEPVLAITRWFEENTLGGTFNAFARKNEPVYLFFDEVQNLDAWAPQIKHLVDNHTVRVMVTGSSSLRIEAGKDSLAGRITSLELGPLLLREIAELRFGQPVESYWTDNGLDKVSKSSFWVDAVRFGQKHEAIRVRAFRAFSERGGYPVAQEKPDTDWNEIASHLTETVIERAIQHDLRMGPRGHKRDERLLEEVFRLCCRYAGQFPGQNLFVPEIRQTYKGNIGWQRILSYLKFLDGTLLIRLVQPLELRLKRRKSPPKICLCDHALRASWLQEIIPLDPDELAKSNHLADLAGHLAESTLGYFLGGIPNLSIAHFPPRGNEPEVDFIMTVGTKRIPIEVKYRRQIRPHEDTVGLRAFLEKTVYNAPFGLLVTQNDNVTVADPRIIPISLSTFLWMR